MSTIRSLAMKVATAFYEESGASAGTTVDNSCPHAEETPSKRPRLSAIKLAYASHGLDMPLSPAAPASSPWDNGNHASSSSTQRTPKIIVEDEIERYKQVAKSVCTSDTVNEWWGKPAQVLSFPCLSQVAGALFGMKPGSGGLECDIGSFGDVISRRRGSLNTGMVEASLMLKLNGDLLSYDTTKVVNLGKEWRNSIPTRAEYPRNYHGDESEDDADNEDGGAGNSGNNVDNSNGSSS